MLKNRARDSLLKVVTNANIENKEFGKVDEYISYLKEEAGKNNLNPEEVDMLALR